MKKIIILFLIGFSAALAKADPAFVQSASTEAFSTTSASRAFTSGNGSGNLLITCLRIPAPALSATITDSNSNTYSTAISGCNSSFCLQIDYSSGAIMGANTVTANYSGSATTLALAIHEYSNASALDGTSSAFGVPSPPGEIGSGTVMTTHDIELLFGCGAGSNFVSPGTGFTGRENVGSISQTQTEDLIVTSTGSYRSLFSQGGGAWTATLATFYAPITPSNTGNLLEVF